MVPRTEQGHVQLYIKPHPDCKAAMPSCSSTINQLVAEKNSLEVKTRKPNVNVVKHYVTDRLQRYLWPLKWHS